MLPPPQLEASWKNALQNEWSKPYLNQLADFVAQERNSNIPVYPPKNDVFNALNQASFEQVQVVIVGQDPYHGPGQAHGLSFSVPKGVRQPPSLKNIFKELHDDLNIPPPQHGCLLSWALQGVLMLNAVLTVRAHQPYSHAGKGWEQFTDAIIGCLSQRKDPVIFVLWGKAAQEKCRAILSETVNRHFVLTAPHPSPYSAHSGFFGCHHFSKINDLLKRQEKKPIDWAIT
ncbi:MAG: uracil-DNA glycosylase [Chlamydiales bacterium]